MTLLAVILTAAGTALAVGACSWLLRGWARRRRRHRAEQAAATRQGAGLWEDFDSPPARHPATRLQHGAGALLYFSDRSHAHPFPPPRGYRCPAADCNWPRR